MTRASERAAELAKKRKTIETRLLAAAVEESSLHKELYILEGNAMTCREQLVAARAARQDLGDELAAISDQRS